MNLHSKYLNILENIHICHGIFEYHVIFGKSLIIFHTPLAPSLLSALRSLVKGSHGSRLPSSASNLCIIRISIGCFANCSSDMDSTLEATTLSLAGSTYRIGLSGLWTSTSYAACGEHSLVGDSHCALLGLLGFYSSSIIMVAHCLSCMTLLVFGWRFDRPPLPLSRAISNLSSSGYIRWPSQSFSQPPSHAHPTWQPGSAKLTREAFARLHFSTILIVVGLSSCCAKDLQVLFETSSSLGSSNLIFFRSSERLRVTSRSQFFLHILVVYWSTIFPCVLYPISYLFDHALWLSIYVPYSWIKFSRKQHELLSPITYTLAIRLPGVLVNKKIISW